jgi:tight adherence protein B
MRRRALLAAAACLGALSGPGAAAAGEQPRLTELGDGRFPERSYVLTLPGRTAVQQADVVVRENGGRVADLSVESAGADGGRDRGVVLVIDASRSMRGEPIQAAMEAARAFARRRAPQQPLAVVTFNATPTVLLPFTTDAAMIDRVLAAPPPLGRSTHVHDGAAAAVRLLQAARVPAGAVIVLSDGADTGSRAGAAQVAAAARRARARIFTVGLESGAFDPSSLRALVSGGRYTPASSPRQLAAIYDELAAQLASEHLIRYRSLAGAGQRIDVFVRVRGVPGTAVSGYRTPRTAVDPTPPFQRSLAERFWRSPVAIVAISLIVALALALAIVALLRPSGRELRTRLAQFVSMPGADAGRGPGLTGQVFEGAERSLRRTRWWDRFVEELEIARIETRPVHIVLGTGIATLFVMWLLAAIGPVLVPLGICVPLAARAVIRRRLVGQRRLFAGQLAENLQVVASAMRAGHSFPSALAVVVEEAAEPSKAEFRRVVADEQLGVPLEDALEVVCRRMDNTDLEQVGIVAALQRETGGNTAEVLDRVAETLRARGELRRLVHTLTAQGRLARWIVSLLPVVLIGVLTVISPGYLDPIWTTTAGNVVLAISAGMVICGSLIIGRIVDIKV